jgi:prepilin-type N-terminal cleavage/methylation domain-containing protein
MKLCVNQWLVGQGGLTPPPAFSSPSVPDGALRTARPTAAASAGRAFTLIEMLVVLGIIGVLAAMTLPSFKKAGKGNVTETATRQLLDDLGYARLKAISGRTKVYVVFVPDYNWFTVWATTPSLPSSCSPNFGAAYSAANLSSATTTNYLFFNPAANNVVGGQLTSYAIFSPRQVGDQPGQSTPRYLTDWRSLPDGAFIPAGAFRQSTIFHNVPFSPITNGIPVEEAPGVWAPPLPFIGFDEQGRLLGRNVNIAISIVEGSIMHLKETTGLTNIVVTTDAVETAAPVPSGSIVAGFEYLVIDPPGFGGTPGSTSINYPPVGTVNSGRTFVGTAGNPNFTTPGGGRVVHHYGVRIDWVTGRAKAVKPELQ